MKSPCASYQRIRELSSANYRKIIEETNVHPHPCVQEQESMTSISAYEGGEAMKGNINQDIAHISAFMDRHRQNSLREQNSSNSDREDCSFKVSSGLVEGGSTEDEGMHSELVAMQAAHTEGLTITDEERYELENNRMTIALQEKKILAMEQGQVDIIKQTKKLREVEQMLFKSREECAQLKVEKKSM